MPIVYGNDVKERKNPSDYLRLSSLAGEIISIVKVELIKRDSLAKYDWALIETTNGKYQYSGKRAIDSLKDIKRGIEKAHDICYAGIVVWKNGEVRFVPPIKIDKNWKCPSK